MRDPRPRNRKARRRADRTRPKGNPSTLTALTSAAVSLFSHTEASAGEFPIEDIGISYAYTKYKEDDLPSSKLAFGDPDRYEIDTHQVSLDGLIVGRYSAGFDFIYESMSGATPWFVIPSTTGGQPEQVMTAATISEQRYDISAYSNIEFDTGRLGARIGGSTENDYSAFYMSFNADKAVNDKNTTLSLNVGFSIDTISPTGGGNRDIDEEDKNSVSLYAGFDQIIARYTILQAGVSYKHSKGFLSDPYKLAYIDLGNRTVPDTRPDTRDQIAATLKLRQHIEPIDASVHFDYRFGWDDWDLISHTFELKWYQNFFDDLLQIIPNFRYYSQSQTYFYEAVYQRERADGLASSDYRLAPFGALAFGARAQVRLEDIPWDLDWRLGLAYERYMANADYAFGSVSVVNPGLVKYNMYYFTLEMRFF